MTVRKLQHLLKPEFSERGSNARMFEGDVYRAFIKYVREAASKLCHFNNKMKAVIKAQESKHFVSHRSESQYIKTSCTWPTDLRLHGVE